MDKPCLSFPRRCVESLSGVVVSAATARTRSSPAAVALSADLPAACPARNALTLPSRSAPPRWMIDYGTVSPSAPQLCSAPTPRSLLVVVEASLAFDEPFRYRRAPVHPAAADFDAWRAAPGCAPAAQCPHANLEIVRELLLALVVTEDSAAALSRSKMGARCHFVSSTRQIRDAYCLAEDSARCLLGSVLKSGHNSSGKCPVDEGSWLRTPLDQEIETVKQVGTGEERRVRTRVCVG
jgi:hypothetical protein